MINLKEIANKHEFVKNKLKTRGFNVKIIDTIVNLAKKRSQLMQSLQRNEAKRNELSREIGILKSKEATANSLIDKVSTLKTEIEQIKAKTNDVNQKLHKILLEIPNLPHDSVPKGHDELANVVIKEHILGFGKVLNVKPHYEYGVERELIDFQKAVKISGSRYWIYQKKGAKLLRALENFMLNEHIKKGYVEVIPPLIVNRDMVQGTGQLPKFESDLFKIANQDCYLIPTSEVPLTNLYARQIIDLTTPKMLTSFTPCFRSEAGSGGKDMRGLIRGHQFYKVEVVKITSRDDLESEFNKTLNDCKAILEKLGLTYREVMLCTGDLGFAAEKTIDLEVWIPSEKRFREVSSVSSFGDFQARRAMIRYRDQNKNNQYACTINGSGVAIDRVFAAILEIYQQKDNSLLIPPVLVPYFQEKQI